MTFRDTEGGKRVQEAQTPWQDCSSELCSASTVSLQAAEVSEAAIAAMFGPVQ